MTKPASPVDVPRAALWQGPMAWVGSPPTPVEDYSREFPANAVFVRAELLLTLAESIGPGMTRQTERAIPGLIRLERGRPVEVHAPGLDGQCWTYRPTQAKRQRKWSLFKGP